MWGGPRARRRALGGPRNAEIRVPGATPGPETKSIGFGILGSCLPLAGGRPRPNLERALPNRYFSTAAEMTSLWISLVPS